MIDISLPYPFRSLQLESGNCIISAPPLGPLAPYITRLGLVGIHLALAWLRMALKKGMEVGLLVVVLALLPPCVVTRS